MGDIGVIYYATGEKYLNQAKISARSLKQHNDIDITVYTDQDLVPNVFDNVVSISPSDYPFYDRVRYMKTAPYDKVLYLDTDTFICGDVSPLFEVLSRVEIAAAINETRDTAAPHTLYDTVDIDAPETFPEYQCGVLAYRNTSSVEQVFDNWQTRYKPYREDHLLDQPHFREALYKSNLQIATLPTEWNALVNLGGYIQNKVKIIHYAGSVLQDRRLKAKDFSKLCEQLNKNAPDKRVFIYDGKTKVYTRTSRPGIVGLGKIFVNNVRNEGLIKSVKHAKSFVENTIKSY